VDRTKPLADAQLYSMLYSPSGSFFAVAGDAPRIVIYAPRTNGTLRHIKTIPLPDKACVLAMAWRDDRFLAFCGSRGLVGVATVQDAHAHKFSAPRPGSAPPTPGIPPPLTLRCSGYACDVNSIAFSSCGHYLAAAGADGSISLWTPFSRPVPPSGRDPTVPPLLRYHCFDSDIYAVALSPQQRSDGSRAPLRLAAVSIDGGVFIASVQPSTGPRGTQLVPTPIAARDFHLKASYDLAFSPSGQHVITGSLDGTLKIWDVLSGRVTVTIPIGTPGSGAFDAQKIVTLSLSADGRMIAAGCIDGSVVVFSSGLPG
jgi:WD40 repeat protein